MAIRILYKLQELKSSCSKMSLFSVSFMSVGSFVFSALKTVPGTRKMLTLKIHAHNVAPSAHNRTMALWEDELKSETGEVFLQGEKGMSKKTVKNMKKRTWCSSLVVKVLVFHLP